VDWEMIDIQPSPAARSLGELVGVWITMFETGAWSYDSAAREWIYDDARIPAHLYRSPLV
jgi:hypothetical protein